MVARPHRSGVSLRPVFEDEGVDVRLSDLEARARRYLEALGRADHPDAETNPVYALYQVAVDFRCSAHGYRALYLERQDFRD